MPMNYLGLLLLEQQIKYQFMRIFSFIFSMLILILSGSAQELDNYSKIKIDLRGHSILELDQLGIETDHGILHKEKSITNIYSAYEIKLIEEAGFEYKTIIADVQEFYALHQTMSEEDVELENRSVDCNTLEGNVYEFETPENYSFGSMGGYLTYDEAIIELDSMAMLYPELITAKTPIGDIQTHRGNEVYHFVISDNPNDSEGDEPQLLYTALHHAREPNSLSQMIFYMWYLLENYEQDSEVQYLVDNTEMFFIPIVNPDGYMINEEIAPNGGGLHRKNARLDDNGNESGVDLNRNYGFFWGYDDFGSSPEQDRQTYRGPEAFSEPETQAVRDLCEANNFEIALNYHTYGNLLIHPWGYEDGPTEEDDLFKRLGNTMAIDNNYLIGTGLETVGYTVNGDSDDWMYGEQETKNKIYSLTPEVGPGFWPLPSQIDQLNKSSLRHNLNAAHLTHNYGVAKEEFATSTIFPGEGSLFFAFEKVGLKDGPMQFDVSALTAGVTIADGFTNLDELLPGESQSITVDYSVSESLTEGDEIRFLLKINNGVFEKVDTLIKFFNEIPADAFEITNPVTEDTEFTSIPSSGWGLTTESFVSAPTSMTDSPNGNYQGNTSTFLYINTALDLTSVEEANFKFFAKWAIEEGFDYVQPQVTIGDDFYVPICGLHTKGSVNQFPETEPVYDGFQNDWIEETICLNDYIGENDVRMRFEFGSDQGVTEDGFYFDDIKFELFGEQILSTEFPTLTKISIMPNPSFDLINLSVDKSLVNNGPTYVLTNVLGEIVDQGSIYQPEIKMDLMDQTDGVYFLQIRVGEKIIHSNKIIKQ